MKSDSDLSSDPAPTKRRFRLADRAAAIRVAAAGLIRMVATQHNARIHLFATISVVCLGLAFRIRADEWCWITAAVTLVWVAEALNTAIELLGDAVTTEFHPGIGHAKDVAAGAVLAAAVFAVIVGLTILGPYVNSLRLQ